MEVCQHFQQLLVRFINPPDQVAHLVFFEVLSERFQTMLHELIDFNSVVVLVTTVNCKAQ